MNTRRKAGSKNVLIRWANGQVGRTASADYVVSQCDLGQTVQRRTCNAPGLTILVGVPLMKLMTLSKAEPK
jgi:hypothetical protein